MASELADRIVAVVNTEPITLYELRRAAAPYLALERRKTPDEKEFQAFIDEEHFKVQAI